MCMQVATVAIGNAANAGLLAIRILGTSDPALLQKMMEYQVGAKLLRLICLHVAAGIGDMQPSCHASWQG